MFGHRFTGGGCNQAIAAVTFEIDAGAYSSFSVPMPTCKLENLNMRIRCTAPAGANKRRIEGSTFGTTTQNPHTVDVMAWNSRGEAFLQRGIFIP